MSHYDSCRDDEYKEEEPKTKKVAVIWFGDAPEWWDKMKTTQVEILFRGQNSESDYKEWTEDAEDIDPDKLRYGVPKKGDEYFDPTIQHFTDAVIDFEEEYFIIDPPTPEPETVEDVLKDMPDITGYPDTPRGHQSFMENQNVGLWFKRLKAAQEVE